MRSVNSNLYCYLCLKRIKKNETTSCCEIFSLKIHLWPKDWFSTLFNACLNSIKNFLLDAPAFYYNFLRVSFFHSGNLKFGAFNVFVDFFFVLFSFCECESGIVVPIFHIYRERERKERNKGSFHWVDGMCSACYCMF